MASPPEVPAKDSKFLIHPAQRKNTFIHAYKVYYSTSLALSLNRPWPIIFNCVVESVRGSKLKCEFDPKKQSGLIKEAGIDLIEKSDKEKVKREFAVNDYLPESSAQKAIQQSMDIYATLLKTEAESILSSD